jgi:Leucine-rich repeat (LRR) protein
MSFCSFSGTPHLYQLPPRLTTLDLRHNDFSGTVGLSELPTTLTSLSISCNRISGSPNLCKLPSKLTTLVLRHNQLSGTPNLSQLPSHLATLDLSINHLSGTPDICHLPLSLTKLLLSDNDFSGTLDISCLPQNLATLDISYNRFANLTVPADSGRASFPKDLCIANNPWSVLLRTQPHWITTLKVPAFDVFRLIWFKDSIAGTNLPSWTGSDPSEWTGVTSENGKVVGLTMRHCTGTGNLNLTCLPLALRIVDISYNQFSGTPDLSQLPPTLVTLDISNNRFTGTPDFSQLPATLVTMNISHNQFYGTPNISILPSTLVTLNLSHNQFFGTANCSRLPPKTGFLDLSHNRFVGIIVPTNSSRASFPKCSYLNNNSWNATLPTQPEWVAELMQNEGAIRLLRFKQSIQGVDLTSWSVTIPPEKWRGVTCENGDVIRIELSSLGAVGNPDLYNLPSSLRELNLYNNSFTGQLRLHGLPCGLLHLFLGNNQFFGTPDISSLPRNLETLALGDNQFSGTLQLSALPVEDHRHPDIWRLPQTLGFLDLGNNQFTDLEIFINSHHHFFFPWHASNHEDEAPALHAPRKSFPENLYLHSNPWQKPLRRLPQWMYDLMQ